ncbi:MAG: SLC13 family permease [Phycisphaerales bacterium]|nr:SLC13 family permease [Phycisphaerales bacterium]
MLANWEAILTGILLVLMVGTMAMGRFAPDIIMMGVLVILLITGVLEPDEAVAGFANRGLITVGMLYIVAAAMKETGAMSRLTAVLLGRPKDERSAQVRLTIPVAFMSAFINNTPIVAMFLPTLAGVARRCKIAPSKLFMPLSFASILGGVCTLIGTSTNVITAKLLDDANLTTDGGPVTADNPALEFGMFTLAKVGLPIAIIGVAYILIFGRKLLPDRTNPIEDAETQGQGYHAALKVNPESPIVGKTVEAANLRNLPGLFLSRIERDDDSIVAVSPQQVVKPNDVLVFVGQLESVVDLQQIKGLVPSTVEQREEGSAQNPATYRPNLRIVEAVVSNNSSLVGITIRESGIRTRYGAVVVAVRRQGQQIPGKLGEIRLRPGDTLLLEAPPGFSERFGSTEDFYLVNERVTPAALRHDRAWAAIAILALLVVLISFGVFPPMTAAMFAAGLMILTRCCTGPQARRGIDFQILTVIGASFGIGKAMVNTGLAEDISLTIISMCSSMGPWALLAAIYLLTTVFTASMTNNAAAVLMFPIGVAIAIEQGLNPMPFIVAITVAASCEFSTPIGYQTNLMVMGPGGYKWLDYTRFGGPLTILCGIICVTLAPHMFGGF